MESHGLYIFKEILQLLNGATPVKHECDTLCTFVCISKNSPDLCTFWSKYCNYWMADNSKYHISTWGAVQQKPQDFMGTFSIVVTYILILLYFGGMNNEWIMNDEWCWRALPDVFICTQNNLQVQVYLETGYSLSADHKDSYLASTESLIDWFWVHVSPRATSPSITQDSNIQSNSLCKYWQNCHFSTLLELDIDLGSNQFVL